MPSAVVATGGVQCPAQWWQLEVSSAQRSGGNWRCPVPSAVVATGGVQCPAQWWQLEPSAVVNIFISLQAPFREGKILFHRNKSPVVL